jgi:hypothetical protein
VTALARVDHAEIEIRDERPVVDRREVRPPRLLRRAGMLPRLVHLLFGQREVAALEGLDAVPVRRRPGLLRAGGRGSEEHGGERRDQPAHGETSIIRRHPGAIPAPARPVRGAAGRV